MTAQSLRFSHRQGFYPDTMDAPYQALDSEVMAGTEPSPQADSMTRLGISQDERFYFYGAERLRYPLGAHAVVHL